MNFAIGLVGERIKKQWQQQLVAAWVYGSRLATLSSSCIFDVMAWRCYQAVADHRKTKRMIYLLRNDDQVNLFPVKSACHQPNNYYGGI